ncbi:hypothetical protein [Crenothrix polyspora]|uniref:Uncharacterized protein n=1 Tax=Crenothrix polyspora TaxID=360316 RepID=A0A1R4H032_9GAMM|nr:hypothetical protein [Crenothrix polyspora]SJM89607.1 conserved hypothetical protein [Crenothrix polyspora]
MKNSFYLVIPKQKNEPQRLKEFEAKSLRQWLDELPTANLSLATRLIHDFVVELNTIAMPSQLRLDVLEKITPSVHNIEDYLQARLIKTGFPKDANEEKIFSVLISIQKQCAIGYWAVLKELTHRDAGWFKGQNTTLPIQRCIKKLGHIVLSHFIMRMPVPDWVWIDIHSLYKLNENTQNNSVNVVKHFKQRVTAYTPEDCYKQILLFSLADATGLRQKQIPQAYDFIESIAEMVSLKHTPVMQQSQQCMILTDEDKPPYFQTNINSNNDSSVLYLDLTRLYKFMAQQENAALKSDSGFLKPLFGQRDQPSKAPRELLYYLQQRWLGIELHGSVLFTDRFDRYIAIGLSATYDLKNMLSVNDDINHENKEGIRAQSTSDRLLSAVFKESDVLSVGSLISFKKKDEPESSRSLGVVNKVGVINQTGKITFAVHLLASRFDMITCKRRQTDENVEAQKGIFYTIKKATGDKTYVITDYFMFEDNDVVDVFMGQKYFPVIMKNRKNISLGYWQFECQRIAEQVMPEQIKKGYDFI